MSYIDHNLLANENVVYRTYVHWVIFLYPIFWLMLFFVMYDASAYLSILAAYKLALYVPLILAVIEGVRTFIRYTATEFAVTNKRLVVKTGWISRNISEVFLSKIENIQVQQSILGRILGYGNLLVHGTGGTQEAFFLLENPLQLRMKVQEQVEKHSSER